MEHQNAFSAALEESIKARQTAGKRAKTVTFVVAAVQVHDIPSIEDYSKEERSKTWFSRREFGEIKASHKELIRRLSNRECIPDTEDCSVRGLEGRSQANSKNRQNIIMAGILAVLNEQDIQKIEGRNDPEALAIIYRQYSYHSLQAASIMGRRDEAAIAEYTAGHARRPPQHFSPHHFRHGPGDATQQESQRSFQPLQTPVGVKLNIGLQPNNRGVVKGGGPAVLRRPVKPSGGTESAIQRRAAAA
ncbi:hypothetical protein IV203_003125 [Nitzschia inconspicua]|uniref:Uncharacterized protein n=1 Tax=Nitzschia inconspicua TaxID=303405 RepID=A0A9K3PNB1_9STRA|nr:hypothetical protein IV203_003125 [Nitzschia inconspicua]